MLKKILFALLLITVSASFAFAQEDLTPVPYGEDEFTQWQKDLRRFEVIMVGSFPFTMLYSSLGYSVIRWGINGFDDAYAPTLSPDADTVAMTRPENLGVVLAGVGFSLIVAVIDQIIIHEKRKSGMQEESLNAGPEEKPDEIPESS